MRRRLYLLVGAAVLLLAADGAYVLLRLNSSLRSAADGLELAGRDLQDADLAAAERHFAAAFQDAEAAAGAQGHPAFSVAEALPWVGNEATAVRALSQAGSRSARAGLAGVAAARAMGAGDGELTRSIYRDGRVNFAAFARARPHVDEAHRLLAEADSLLDTAPEPSLDAIADAFVTATEEVDRATSAARKGSLLLDMLPGLLGEGSSRRYLLAFQSPSEARGTGGIIGLHGVLEARDGAMRLVEVRGSDEIALAKFGSVEAPGWFREHYGPLSALRQWQQANESPSFPIVSRVLLRMYERVYGEALDGVIGMDPIALQELLAATGPIESEELGFAVTRDNVAEVLMHDSYLLFDDARQARVLASLVADFWARLRDGGVDAAALAKGVAEGVRTQHLKIYSNDPESQKALRALDADGDYSRYGPNVQMAFHNNFAANKVDWFLHRRMDMDVRITADGETRVTTTFTLRNDSPPGPASPLLGFPPFNQYRPGLNGLFFNLLMPAEAQVFRFHINDERAPYILHRDGPYPVAWDIVRIPPGGTAEVFIRYHVQGMLQTFEGDTTFEMTLFPQGLVRPDDFELTVTAPDGTRLVPDGSGDPGAEDETFTTGGLLDEPLEISLQLTRS